MPPASHQNQAAPPRPYLFLGIVLLASSVFYLLNLLQITLPLGLPPSALMIVVPFITARVLISGERGEDAARLWINTTWDVLKVPRPRWLAVAVVLPAAIVFGGYLAGAAFGSAPVGPAPATLGQMLLIFAAYWVGAVIEELGWTAYATRPLQARHGVFVAGVILGTVWALWHVVPYFTQGRDGGWVASQVLLTIGMRVLMGYLFRLTAGTTTPAVFFHASLNAVIHYLPGQIEAYQPGWSALFTWIVVGLFVLLLGTGRPRT